MKDPADVVTTEMFFEDNEQNVAEAGDDEFFQFIDAHGAMPKPASWEEAIDAVVDERNELLDMLESVLMETPKHREKKAYVQKLRAEDAAREAEFSGKGGDKKPR